MDKITQNATQFNLSPCPSNEVAGETKGTVATTYIPNNDKSKTNNMHNQKPLRSRSTKPEVSGASQCSQPDEPSIEIISQQKFEQLNRANGNNNNQQPFSFIGTESNTKLSSDRGNQELLRSTDTKPGVSEASEYSQLTMQSIKMKHPEESENFNSINEHDDDQQPFSLIGIEVTTVFNLQKISISRSGASEHSQTSESYIRIISEQEFEHLNIVNGNNNDQQPFSVIGTESNTKLSSDRDNQELLRSTDTKPEVSEASQCSQPDEPSIEIISKKNLNT